MTEAAKDFPGQAFLELLRPPKLAETKLALFAAYSADPIVLGGALLNLYARGRDTAGGNKSDFVEAVEALRDKVRFIVQRGRVHHGSRLPKIAAVLDQFLVEIPYHEKDHSWHPKAALICYEGEKSRRIWRLWLGSRNLTMSRDLDLGLVLEGEARRRQGSQVIEGISDLGATLATEANLPGISPDALRAELQSLRWMAPDGITVSSVELWTKGSKPEPPFGDAAGRKLVVLSPFLCDAFARSLSQMTAGSPDRTLVTSLAALRKLSPDSRSLLGDFRMLTLSAPSPEGEEADTEATPDVIAIDPATTDEGDEGRPGGAHSGLHAKLFAAIDNDRVDIVAGSANATRRAWSGRNAEVVARFSGGSAEIAGIMAIVGSAMPVSPALLEHPAEADIETAEQELEQIRWAVSDMPLRLCREGRCFQLVCVEALSLPLGARLEVGLATSVLHPWAPGEALVDLGEVPVSLQTDLLQFRLVLEGAAPARWLMRVEVTQGLDPERDAAAISRFLSVAGLQTWLRAMLQGDAGPGAQDDWDIEDSGRRAQQLSWQFDGLALEDILKAWAKDPKQKANSLQRVDAMLDRYVSAILAHGEQLSADERRELAELQQTWGVARDVLMLK